MPKDKHPLSPYRRITYRPFEPKSQRAPRPTRRVYVHVCVCVCVCVCVVCDYYVHI